MYRRHTIFLNFRLVVAAVFSCTTLGLALWLITSDMMNVQIQEIATNQPSLFNVAARYYGAYAMSRD